MVAPVSELVLHSKLEVGSLIHGSLSAHVVLGFSGGGRDDRPGLQLL